MAELVHLVELCEPAGERIFGGLGRWVGPKGSDPLEILMKVADGPVVLGISELFSSIRWRRAWPRAVFGGRRARSRVNSQQERQRAHALLDLLPPAKLGFVHNLLEVMVRDNEEDEEISEEEEAAVARSKEWFQHNEGIPFEQVAAGDHRVRFTCPEVIEARFCIPFFAGKLQIVVDHHRQNPGNSLFPKPGRI